MILAARLLHWSVNGCLFDAALGLASALVPAANTYTQVTYGVMYSSGGGMVLPRWWIEDGTLTDPYNDIPWAIELTDQTDIFLGATHLLMVPQLKQY